MKLAPRHLKRYKDVALLFLKHAHPGVLDPELFAEEREPGHPAPGSGKADELADDLESLGPTFVKIGQLLSTRGDLLPPAHLEALSRLQDHVEPVPFEELEPLVQEELGVRLSKAFADFDREPYASASLGQVHRATLRSGRKVAVKIQRPHIRRQIAEDMESLAEIAAFMDEHTELGKRYEFCRLVDQFRGSILRELDYQKEAANLQELRENLRDYRRLVVPDVIHDFTTSRVLTMEFVDGTKLTKLSGAVKADLDGEALAEELFHAYLDQILVHGFFHADPHPGNLLLTPDHRIAILDLGMVGRVNQRLRDHLVHLLAGVSDGDGIQTAEAALRITEPRVENVDRAAFIREIETVVGENKSASLESLKMGSLVLRVTNICAQCGLRVPQEIAMLGKTFLNLDRIGEELAPAFDPNHSVRRHMQEISRGRMKQTLTSANFLGLLTEAKEFLGQFPARMNRIFELMADNKLRVHVDAIDEKLLIRGFQKVANRITLGLILASIVVGAALIMRIETDFRLFGYPGLAMILFLVACAGGLALAATIVFSDRRDQE